jgi:hypothetical protein
VSAIQAARAAATLRRELGVPVDIEDGRYGELTVLVDGEEVASAGLLGFVGIPPSVGTIRAAVEERMASGADACAAAKSQ